MRFEDGSGLSRSRNANAHQIVIFKVLSRWVMVCAFVCTVTLAHTLIKNLTVGINVTHECFAPTLWANPFATFRQLILMLLNYHISQNS